MKQKVWRKCNSYESETIESDPNCLNYILQKNGRIKRCPNNAEYYAWWGNTQNRKIGWDIVEHDGKKFTISTVFLGLDHNHSFTGTAVLFETMVFNDTGRQDGLGDDVLCSRHTNLAAAKAYHRRTVRMVKNGTI